MHAQLGKIAANTKTGKTEKVTPNDQCLAPISLPNQTIGAWHPFADSVPADSLATRDQSTCPPSLVRTLRVGRPL